MSNHVPVCISRGKLQNLRSAGAMPPLGCTAWMTSYRQAPSHITTPNLVILHQRVQAQIEGNARNCRTPGLRPLRKGAWLTLKLAPLPMCVITSNHTFGFCLHGQFCQNTSYQLSLPKHNLFECWSRILTARQPSRHQTNSIRAYK